METVATEAGASPAAVRTGKLGRFTLGRVLGRGGMGTVYEAVDDTLERTVAIKILHDGDHLDEARAIAKLSHDNVVAIYEVGDDYFVMERIDGELLGQWTTGKPWRDIVRAYAAAGRGLAAAHAAGLVHRDFKPANVLRARSGRVVVTDFGLAREPDAASSIAGTPGYMAPEQWLGEPAGPAADQYALCASLWEAVAGQPHARKTSDELRAAALAGTRTGTVPRPLAPILRRGLARDPKARWPSMTALVAALDALAARRKRIAVASGAIVVIGGIALAIAWPRGGGETCRAPAIEPPRVIALRDASLAAFFAGDVATWSEVRAQACEADPQTREPQLACLDGVMARLDAAIALSTREPVSDGGPDAIGAMTLNPGICAHAPHLALSPDAIAAYAERVRVENRRVGDEAIVSRAVASTEPCARAIGIEIRYSQFSMAPELWKAGALPELGQLVHAAETCTDDAVRAEILVASLLFPSGAPALDRAQRSVDACPDDLLLAQLDVYRAGRLAEVGRLDDAIATMDRAFAEYGRRHYPSEQAEASLRSVRLLALRAGPTDDDAILAVVANWLASARPFARGELDREAALVRWRRGDLARADDALDRTPRRGKLDDGITGVVVDEHGKPVADAEVATAVFPPVSDGARLATPALGAEIVTTRSQADGTFTLPRSGRWLSARTANQAGESQATDGVVVKLVPTARVAGHVELAGAPRGHYTVHVATASGFRAIGPVLDDGSFSIAGVPIGPARLLVGPLSNLFDKNGGTPVVVGQDTDVALRPPPLHPLAVIERSRDLTIPTVGETALIGGPIPDHVTFSMMSGRALELRLAGHVDAAIAPAGAHPDDLVALFPDRPSTTTAVCALAATEETFFDRLTAAYQALPMTCVKVQPDDTVIMLDLPPMQRVR